MSKNGGNLLTVPEAARMLHLSERDVNHLCENGTLTTRKAGRSFRVTAETVERYRVEHETQTRPTIPTARVLSPEQVVDLERRVMPGGDLNGRNLTHVAAEYDVSVHSIINYLREMGIMCHSYRCTAYSPTRNGWCAAHQPTRKCPVEGCEHYISFSQPRCDDHMQPPFNAGAWVATTDGLVGRIKAIDTDDSSPTGWRATFRDGETDDLAGASRVPAPPDWLRQHMDQDNAPYMWVRTNKGTFMFDHAMVLHTGVWVVGVDMGTEITDFLADAVTLVPQLTGRPQCWLCPYPAEEGSEPPRCWRHQPQKPIENQPVGATESNAEATVEVDLIDEAPQPQPPVGAIVVDGEATRTTLLEDVATAAIMYLTALDEYTAGVQTSALTGNPPPSGAPVRSGLDMVREALEQLNSHDHEQPGP